MLRKKTLVLAGSTFRSIQWAQVVIAILNAEYPFIFSTSSPLCSKYFHLHQSHTLRLRMSDIFLSVYATTDLSCNMNITAFASRDESTNNRCWKPWHPHLATGELILQASQALKFLIRLSFHPSLPRMGSKKIPPSSHSPMSNDNYLKLVF